MCRGGDPQRAAGIRRSGSPRLQAREARPRKGATKDRTHRPWPRIGGQRSRSPQAAQFGAVETQLILFCICSRGNQLGILVHQILVLAGGLIFCLFINLWLRLDFFKLAMDCHGTPKVRLTRIGHTIP